VLVKTETKVGERDVSLVDSQHLKDSSLNRVWVRQFIPPA